MAVVYEGVVTHRRFKPVSHFLKYRVFSFLITLDELDALSKRLRFFSRGRFNLFSFHDADHGAGRPADIEKYIRTTLKAAGYSGDGDIRLLCYPRMLGYVFNPLSVYYCEDASGRLEAIIYEVNSTFGERHSYIAPVSPDNDGLVIRQEAEKRLHVSPFMPMDAPYKFDLTRPAEKISVAIRQADAEGPLLNAFFSGDARPLDDRALVALFFRYPLMTIKVIAGIHLEAVKLLWKGLKLRSGPVAPETPVSAGAERFPNDRTPRAEPAPATSNQLSDPVHSPAP